MAPEPNRSADVPAISDGKAAEALRARMVAIVDASGDAIISLTTDGVIETWNESAAGLYGYSAQEAIGQPAVALLARDPAERAQMLARVAAGAGLARTMSQDVRKDGSFVDVSVTDSAIRDRNGLVVGIARIARDITALVEGEAALRRAQVQADAGRDQALEASRMKSAFLANMSHEIRTPLNGVIGMADLLLDSPLDVEQRDNARLLRGAGETLVTVVDDILDFSKIEAGALRLEDVDFDLIEAVEDACDLIAESAGEKGIELTIEFAPDLPEIVRGDAVRVRQVICNLLSNALKFTLVGEMRVILRTAPSSDDLLHVHFEVADTGIGIDASRLEQMFMPFVQADDSTTRRFGGSGLGLAIVKQLVEMMGGEVGAESLPGEGSRFWFTVAFERAAPPDAGADGEPHTALAGIRLLAVDDNETNRSLILQLARSWEIDVVAVAGARQALARLREAAARREPYDCAALDMHMPDTSGIQLAQAICEDDSFPTPALVMLTSTSGHRREARDAGIDVYTTKPVGRTRLRATLTEAMAIKMRRDRPPAPEDDCAPLSPLILIVEDNEVNQILAIRMVERRGYRAEAVGDGREAVKAMRWRRYGAVLMDCQMPELNGYDATGELRRQEPDGAHTPVIAMTAHALRGDREKCLASGMDDYLAKPIRPEELDRVLRRWAPCTAALPAEVPPMISTGPPETTALLDAVGVARLRSELGSAEAFLWPIALFATHTPELLADLRTAIAAGDGEAVRRAAHKLKGGCLTLSAIQMAELCNELETCTGAGPLGSIGPPGGAARLVERLEAAFGHTHAALLAAAAQAKPPQVGN